MDAFLSAEVGNAGLAPQALEDDPDLFLDGRAPKPLPEELLDRPR
jgi:hypothetical protein